MISLASDNPAAQVPASLTIPQGKTSATTDLTTTTVPTDTVAKITASYVGTSASANLTINSTAISTLTIAPSTLVGGDSAVGMVTLSGPAPTGGLTVMLTSDASAVPVPTSILIATGTTSKTFDVKTKAVTSKVSATVVASAGSSSKSVAVTVQPATLQTVTLSAPTVIGGTTASITGTVTLTGPAPVGGLVVNLSSSKTSVAVVPSSVKVSWGAKVAQFTVTHYLTPSTETLTITGNLDGISASTPLKVSPVQPSGIVIAPNSVTGGTSTTVTVTLNGTVRSKATVKLSSTSSAAVIPATITVAAGASTASFEVKTIPVATLTQAVLAADLGGVAKRATLAVKPATFLSLTLSPTTVQGSSTQVVTATVTFSGPAPSGGFLVNLTTTSSSVIIIPSSVTVGQGKTTATFTVGHKKVTAQLTGTIKATYADKSKSAPLTLTP